MKSESNNGSTSENENEPEADTKSESNDDTDKAQSSKHTKSPSENRSADSFNSDDLDKELMNICDSDSQSSEIDHRRMVAFENAKNLNVGQTSDNETMFEEQETTEENKLFNIGSKSDSDHSVISDEGEVEYHFEIGNQSDLGDSDVEVDGNISLKHDNDIDEDTSAAEESEEGSECSDTSTSKDTILVKYEHLDEASENTDDENQSDGEDSQIKETWQSGSGEDRDDIESQQCEKESDEEVDTRWLSKDDFPPVYVGKYVSLPKEAARNANKHIHEGQSNVDCDDEIEHGLEDDMMAGEEESGNSDAGTDEKENISDSSITNSGNNSQEDEKDIQEVDIGLLSKENDLPPAYARKYSSLPVETTTNVDEDIYEGESSVESDGEREHDEEDDDIMAGEEESGNSDADNDEKENISDSSSEKCVKESQQDDKDSEEVDIGWLSKENDLPPVYVRKLSLLPMDTASNADEDIHEKESNMESDSDIEPDQEDDDLMAGEEESENSDADNDKKENISDSSSDKCVKESQQDDRDSEEVDIGWLSKEDDLPPVYVRKLSLLPMEDNKHIDKAVHEEGSKTEIEAEFEYIQQDDIITDEEENGNSYVGSNEDENGNNDVTGDTSDKESDSEDTKNGKKYQSCQHESDEEVDTEWLTKKDDFSPVYLRKHNLLTMEATIDVDEDIDGDGSNKEGDGDIKHDEQDKIVVDEVESGNSDASSVELEDYKSNGNGKHVSSELICEEEVSKPESGHDNPCYSDESDNMSISEKSDSQIDKEAILGLAEINVSESHKDDKCFTELNESTKSDSESESQTEKDDESEPSKEDITTKSKMYVRHHTRNKSDSSYSDEEESGCDNQTRPKRGSVSDRSASDQELDKDKSSAEETEKNENISASSDDDSECGSTSESESGESEYSDNSNTDDGEARHSNEDTDQVKY